MDNLRNDLAYSFRRLLSAPVFSVVAIATLALGIGANSAIFSIVNAVVLKPLPYPEPERLVALSHVYQGRVASVMSPMNFLDVKRDAKSFESMTAFDGNSFTLTEHGAPMVLRGANVSGSFFDVVGVRPAIGRGFHEDENEPSKRYVAVIGHSLWQKTFGGDPAIIGKRLRLDSESYEVVGITPPGFSYPEGIEVWTPLLHDENFLTKSRGAWYLGVVGRLKTGVSIEAGRQEGSTIMARLVKDFPEANEGISLSVRSLHETTVGDTRPALLMLLGAVGLVLLIACVNVANLMLARVASRESEFAVRQAMGASRSRIFRQLMTESLLLAGLGGGAGILLAQASLGALLALQPAQVPRLSQASIDGPVFLFAGLIALATGLFFGTFPALKAWRPTAVALREGARGLSAAHAGRVRNALVVGQMALAMMLLVGAGLLLKSFVQLQNVKPGFETGSALTFNLSLPEAAYPDEARHIAFFNELIPKLEALPGATAVGAISGLPLNRTRFNISFEIKNRPAMTPAQQPSMEMRVATPGYFKAMGIPIVQGRGFVATDSESSSQVVLISQAAARKHFPNENALGQWITMGYGSGKGKKAGGEIVGIVGDVKDRGLAVDAQPEIYLPYAQVPFNSMDLLVRTSVEPMSLGTSVESTVHGLDKEMPVARLKSLEALVANSISQPRFYTTLLGIFAAVAVALAALGIFGVMSYTVVQRSREIGVRLALGANPSSVLAMVLRQALTLALAGVAGGLAGALALSKTISGLLFQLTPTDPATLGGVAVLLTFVALAASYIPARQATRVDPLVTLRSE